MTERISEDELVYHGRVVGQLKAAQAAWESWCAHLADRYQLGEAGRIDERGEIVRAGS